MLATVTLLCGVLLGDAEPDSVKCLPVGQQMPAFSLQDFRGQRLTLDRFTDAKALVVVFLGTECPIVQLYAKRLQELADQYGEAGVVVLGIDSNQQDSLAELEHFARTHRIRFPILRDSGNRVADLWGASRTPEVFVLDSKRTLRYHGRFDDQFTYETQRDNSRNDYVKQAVDALLKQQPLTITETEVVGCHIGRVFKKTRDRGVTYCGQIRRILQNRCESCHRAGEIAPFELTDYDEVVGWAEMIDEVVEQQRMPPWHASSEYGTFSNDRRMTDQEKQLIHQWVSDGAPKGDAADLPAERKYVTGWQLPRKPDRVIPMAGRPFRVAGTGTIKYQYFVVDPKFQEDQWISMAEVVPGNRRVVHHVLVFAQPKGVRSLSGERGGFLAAYVPGLRAEPFPAGMAKRVRAGSRIVFQVHYTPIGTDEEDISSIGLVFARPRDVKYEVRTVAAVNTRFSIPPRDPDFEVTADSQRAQVDVLALAFMPHMHLRGKAFRYEALFPTGDSEILVDIPRYDFNWQTAYRLSTPMRLPAGTRVHCTARFDNSAKNLANPDPDRTVQWGDQTWDEMMIGYMDVAIPRSENDP